MSTSAREPSFRRAAVLMTVTSFLVPLGGLITAPVLARGLGTDGRGEMAAALAPAVLMLGVATLGLPDALTYHLAKRPSITRHALLWASVMTAALGVLCVGATAIALPFLSAGDPDLAGLILFAIAWTVPALVIGVLRGAATGRQMWRTVAAERVLMTALRILLFGGLWIAGALTVFSAVVISIALPIVAGLVYIGLLRKPPHDMDLESEAVGVVRPLLGFGLQGWLGGVASMVLSRLAPLLMVPLSTAYDLGLYTVASTISDLPLIVALAIQGALIGVNSRTADAARLARTARLTLLVGTAGCAVLALCTPLLLGILFGQEFVTATVPTLLLLLSSVICIPGLMASSGLSAWGKPALRSIGLVVALVVNLGSFVLLVPFFGVYGACWTSVVSNVALTVFMMIAAGRTLGISPLAFVAVGPADFRLGWHEATRMLRKMRLGRAA